MLSLQMCRLRWAVVCGCALENITFFITSNECCKVHWFPQFPSLFFILFFYRYSMYIWFQRQCKGIINPMHWQNTHNSYKSCKYNVVNNRATTGRIDKFVRMFFREILEILSNIFLRTSFYFDKLWRYLTIWWFLLKTC